MPVFCWTSLASCLIMLAAFPVLTVALAELMLDRYLGFHFFTNDGGGNSMLYMNLIWVWGHPEVYILVLPAFGIYSEIASTFSGKPLFGYRSMVFATLVICILSYCVWLHHFFTMGAGGDVNAVFGIASMLIGIPTGVKMYNWLFTMYGGRVRFTVPMHYLIGFMLLFVGGGLTGVLLAIPPVDFVVHNSLFLVAHFHHVIIPGVVFAVLPDVHGEEAYWHRKQEAIERDALIPEPNYQPIEMPLNTPVGVICAFFASVCGFAVIWYIWWLAILGLIGAFAIFVWYAWRDEHEHIIPVEEVRANARERRRIRMEHLHTLSQST